MNFAVVRGKRRINPSLHKAHLKVNSIHNSSFSARLQHYAALRTKQSILTTVTKPVEVWCFECAKKIHISTTVFVISLYFLL